MSIVTTKGQRIDVTKANPGLTKYRLALGWEPKDKSQEWDLDVSVFVLGANKKLLSDAHLIFYNNIDGKGTKSEQRAGKGIADAAFGIFHSGDNRTGAGAGDDETIDIDFSKIDPAAEFIVAVVTIHDAIARRQNFGMVGEAYARLLNGEDLTTELARYDLTEDFSIETSINFVELYKKDGEWKMNSTGIASPGTLDDHIALYQA